MTSLYIGVGVGCFFWILVAIFLPILQTRPLKATHTPKEVFDAQNAARTTIFQAGSGVLVVVGVFITLYQIRVSQEDLINAQKNEGERLREQIVAQTRIAEEQLASQHQEAIARQTFEAEQELQKRNYEGRLAETAEQQRIYSELAGLNVLRTQYYTSYYGENINFLYSERRWSLQGAPEKSVFLDQANSSQQQASTLAVDLAKTNQRMLELIGLARLHFPNTSQFLAAWDSVLRTPNLQMPISTGNVTGAELDRWKFKAINDLPLKVAQVYSTPVINLLNIMGQSLDSKAAGLAPNSSAKPLRNASQKSHK